MEKFNVVQFFEDNSYEYVRRNVDAAEAVKAFEHYTNNVACKLGVIERVIITDSGDCINMEWQHGLGVVFPLPSDTLKNPEV
jgi:hypothetical protein